MCRSRHAVPRVPTRRKRRGGARNASRLAVVDQGQNDDTRDDTAVALVLKLFADGPQLRSSLIVASRRPESAIAQALSALKRHGLVARQHHASGRLPRQDVQPIWCLQEIDPLNAETPDECRHEQPDVPAAIAALPWTVTAGLGEVVGRDDGAVATLAGHRVTQWTPAAYEGADHNDG
jgi:hypothetical protein